MSPEETQLWTAYRRYRRDCDRNALCERYLALAKVVAGKIYRTVPNTVEWDDLYSAACQGLLESIERFDPEKGVLPSSYFPWRIHGACLDFLRSLDSVTRAQRQKLNQVDRLEQQLGRPATPEEIQEHLGRRLVIRDTVHISELRQGERCEFDFAAPSDCENLSDTSYLLRGLKARERLIVLLYYVEGYRMREVAQSLGVCESRISQLIPGLLDRMKRNANAA